MSRAVFTIGHSNRSFDEFLKLLRAHGVEQVIDVRSIPKSRHNPQFEREALASALRGRRIGYRWLKRLGGRRHTTKASVNTGWHNAAFRGFADYMATAEFAQGLEALEEAARERCVAIMCAEAVPWRCHRSLIADALTKQRWDVRHIVSATSARKHGLTPFLRVRHGVLEYPGDPSERP
jgi:uncharacterized protein (DUF488 family)